MYLAAKCDIQVVVVDEVKPVAAVVVLNRCTR
jgi:hypothetical protein